MVFFSTGNAVPMYGGEIRRGDNLFTASILALDMETGKRRWHYQVVHHDLWDADIATPPVLYEAEVNGARRKALAALRADGQGIGKGTTLQAALKFRRDPSLHQAEQPVDSEGPGEGPVDLFTEGPADGTSHAE